MKKILIVLLSLVFAFALFAGCGSKEETAETSAVEVTTPEPTKAVETATPTPKATATPTPKPTATPTPEPTQAPSLGNINPLTGLATDRDYTNSRAYVFMCNNIYVAAPHAGVSQSDIIMEMMEEGGITRMMAFFMDPTNVPKIGSIRSARAYNIDTAYGYDAFLVHCGSSDEGDAMIAEYGLQDIDQITGAYGDAFYRDAWRIENVGSEHSLYAIGPDVMNAAVNRGYRMEHEAGFDVTYGLSFDENAVSQCSAPANQINVTYNGGKTSDFIYNADTKAYTMYQYGEAYTDDGVAEVPFKNVINIYAYTYLQEDGKHLTIELGQGEGFFFTEGQAAAIKWYKNGKEDVFHFTLLDGTPLNLTPGRTFVAVNQTGTDYQGSCEFG